MIIDICKQCIFGQLRLTQLSDKSYTFSCKLKNDERLNTGYGFITTMSQKQGNKLLQSCKLLSSFIMYKKFKKYVLKLDKFHECFNRIIIESDCPYCFQHKLIKELKCQ